ncbi:hypothetical protein RN001_006509 [Aquatica leii]|uniref:Uncharacterized protein n=1 Tax=Aquatica leii TaxID=1421715 RepID=A0AAN7Q8W5_9COLE|nr:hypothetical protein RN001_006509 [Aquatica leii]
MHQVRLPVFYCGSSRLFWCSETGRRVSMAVCSSYCAQKLLLLLNRQEWRTLTKCIAGIIICFAIIAICMRRGYKHQTNRDTEKYFKCFHVYLQQ